MCYGEKLKVDLADQVCRGMCRSAKMKPMKPQTLFLIAITASYSQQVLTQVPKPEQ